MIIVTLILYIALKFPTATIYENNPNLLIVRQKK